MSAWTDAREEARAQAYTLTNRAWGREVLPPCTRTEAERAVNKLWRRFTGSRARRVIRPIWVSLRETSSDARGWHRLVHDVSHRIYRRDYPNRSAFADHTIHHANLEREMIEYVVAQGWLEGKLKPPVKAKLDTHSKRANRYILTVEAIARWERKEKLAKTYLKKLRARARRLAKVVGAQGEEEAL